MMKIKKVELAEIMWVDACNAERDPIEKKDIQPLLRRTIGYLVRNNGSYGLIDTLTEDDDTHDWEPSNKTNTMIIPRKYVKKVRILR